jgi:hypothetical protein
MLRIYTVGLNVDPALLVRSGRLTEAQARDVSIVSETLDGWIRALTDALLSCVIGS